jgi:transposase
VAHPGALFQRGNGKHRIVLDSGWIPVKNILEGSVEIVLICPKKHKPERGDKTDFRDAQNLAHWHRHGLLKGSFLPSRAIVELRDLTRRRKKLLSNLAAEKNRIQKVLESANVKIGNIISDVFGVSGQAMLSFLLSGEEGVPQQVAELARCRLRQKIPEITEALERHQMNEHHRWPSGKAWNISYCWTASWRNWNSGSERS